MLDECFHQDKENTFTDTTSERTQRQFLKKVEMGFLPIYVERQRWETGGILAVNEGGNQFYGHANAISTNRVCRRGAVNNPLAHNNAIRRVRQIWFFFLEGGGIFSIFFCTILSKNYTTNKNETNEERSPSRGTRFPFLICSSSTV